MAQKPTKKKTISGRTVAVRVLLALAAAVLVFVLLFVTVVEFLPFDASKLTRSSQPTIVYDKNNQPYMTIAAPGSSDVTFSDIPSDLVNALVATEDHTYWNSSSVDVRGILRATFIDLWTQSYAQGGSTIQEQLAKIVYLNDKKTMLRKIRQIVLGVQINRHFTKQEILAMYFNRVYLGENTVGVEQAAMRYFGVDLQKHGKLTLPQAALLAGLPQAPSAYDPLSNPKAAMARRNQVLENMARYGYLTEAKAKAAEKTPLGASYHPLTNDAWDTHPLFTNFLLDYAKHVGMDEETLLQGGLKIYTTVDPQVQSSIDHVFSSSNDNGHFPGPTTGTVVQGAAIFMDPKTGGVLGGAGSRKQDFAVMGLDRVMEAQRSPGSSIKPVLDYAPAIESGKFGPDTIINNTPRNFGGGYTPHNDEANAPASVTLRQALVTSQNVAAVTVLSDIGIDTGIKFAENDGIPFTQKDHQHLGIAIGGMQNGVTPFMMAQAYEPFADNGIQQKAHLINRIVNTSGDTIYAFAPSQKRIMSAQTATIMTGILQGVVEDSDGTGTGARVAGWGVAGKTGTVQYDSGQSGNHHNWISTAWFDGYTPTMVGSIYMGYDDPSPQHHMTDVPYSPSYNCSQVFGDIVRLATQGQTPQQFDTGASPTPTVQGAVSHMQAKWDPVTKAIQLTWQSSLQGQALFVVRRSVAPTPGAQTGTAGTTGGGASGSTKLVQVGETNQPYYEDANVQPGYTYTYQVQAVDPGSQQPIGAAQSITVQVSSDAPGNTTGGAPGAPQPGPGQPPPTGNSTNNSAGNGGSGGTSNGTGNTAGTGAKTGNGTG